MVRIVLGGVVTSTLQEVDMQSPRTIHFVVPGVLIAAVCWAGCGGADLPDGWEGAVAVDEFDAEEVGTTDWDDPDLGAVGILGNLDRLEVSYRAAFPCTQEVEAFQMVSGTDVELLVQPIDLHPGKVAGSDCTLEIDMTVLGLDDGTYHVSLYRRDCAEVDETMEPQLVGEGDAILGFAE